jgi:hypothetical protein
MNFAPNEIRRAQREALRAHARENFYSFYRLIFPALAPEASFSSAPHFRVLARALEKVAKGETRRLLIAIPPRHGKSILASVALPAWILGRDPTRKIICASYGEGLSVPRPAVVARVAGDFSGHSSRCGRRLAFRGAHVGQGVSPRDDRRWASDWQGRAFRRRRRSVQGQGRLIPIRYGAKRCS